VAFELIKDIVKLALIVAFLYLALAVYSGWKQPAWSALVEKRRFAILLALVLAVIGIKVSEDAINLESGPFDLLALQFIHANVPIALTGLFEAATISGSAGVLSPLVIIMVVALLCAKRRYEALLLSASVVSGAMMVYVLKAVVGRARPRLWDTEWYWGSSFPSGHTLVVAALATATVISVTRIWPEWRRLAMLIAFVWVASVGISRLVLGVHWPTDVLAAVCIGMFLPLATGIALESWYA
jgi:membrane-associated phospholipid phosphatase